MSNALKNGTIHRTARIHPGAKIGLNISVGPAVIIGDGVEIGDNCVIGSQVVIEGRTIIGSGNRFAHGCSIGSTPQDYRSDNEDGLLIIGDDNLFKENAIVSRGTDGGITKVGSHSLFMAYSYIGADCKVGNYAVIDNCVGLSKNVVVEERAIIGGLSWVHEDCKVGTMVMVGGCTKIVKDVPPYLLIDGNPARIFGINIVGLRRNGISPEARDEIKKAYRILYRSKITVNQAVTKMEDELSKLPEIEHFIEFIRQSARGILRQNEDIE